MIARLKSQPGGPYRIAEGGAAREVSPSGFYAHQRKAQSQRRQADARLAEQIGVLFLQSRGTYGCRRLRQALRRQQLACGTNRVCRLMRPQGLESPPETPFPTPDDPEPS